MLGPQSSTIAHRCCLAMSSSPGKVARPGPNRAGTCSRSPDVAVAMVVTPMPDAVANEAGPAVVVPIAAVVVMPPMAAVMVMMAMVVMTAVMMMATVVMAVGHRLRRRDDGRTHGHDRESRRLEEARHDLFLSAVPAGPRPHTMGRRVRAQGSRADVDFFEVFAKPAAGPTRLPVTTSRPRQEGPP